jgi:hypothetical protein
MWASRSLADSEDMIPLFFSKIVPVNEDRIIVIGGSK